MMGRALASRLRGLRSQSRVLGRPVPIFVDRRSPAEIQAAVDRDRFPDGGDALVEGISWIEEFDAAHDQRGA